MSNSQFPLYASRIADKFVVRFPDGMRNKIADVARGNFRSMNSEILARLEASLEVESEEGNENLPEANGEGLSADELRLIARFRKLDVKQQSALVELLTPVAQAPHLAKAS
ncbi:TPA: Arc family DNA-binding protein [Pseudomonas aeruginosa]|nr:Arc family DNA-binding protein [Pseudomonas aeruginosa]HCK4563328.1 Arc family DNA-binding protein [Pseudomonas aeruginosa]HCK4774236.1 Arc family DNA-binding protein [Pseudomonas aeruginosa]